MVFEGEWKQTVFQRVINLSSFLFFALFLAPTASAAELKIWVKAFIPSEHPTNVEYVLPRPGHPGQFMIPDPIEAGVCFATDDRMFSSDPAASARMTSAITLAFSDGNLSQAPTHETGETRIFWCADGAEKHPPKSAPTERMFWGTPAQADGRVQVTLEANANNPHVTGSPSIYYAGGFVYSMSERRLSYRLTIGRFPAFEVYAQLDDGEIVKVFNRDPAEGSDVWSLISVGGIGTRNVLGEVNF